MDLNPDEAIAAGWLKEKSLVARLLSRMLLYSLRRADHIIALDRFMKERIQAKGIEAEKISIVPPWSHNDYVRFNPEGGEEFRKIHQISDKFVVMYSGNHSPCHPLDALLQAAERLVDYDDIVFCFVGGGSEFSKVKSRALDRGLRNILCLPYQPREKLSGSLSAADLHVVVMGEQFVGIVHSCKIYNILAVRRPFLYIGPAESHVRDIISRVSLGAYVSSHGDVDEVVANILSARRSTEDVSLGVVTVANRFSKKSIVPQMISAIENGPAVGTRTRLRASARTQRLA
jgi:hypothetical protein